MRYIPHTEAEIKDMLSTIGVSSVDGLFAGIPKDLQLTKDLPLPVGLAETELRGHIRAIAESNICLNEGASFMGAGAYHHYVPSVIAQLAKRGEFLTAYTPYQPEVSQGTLQAIFEFQTMVSELTGMDIANASNYDLSTACSEAAQMARRINKQRKILVTRATHPHYRDVLRTYFRNQDVEIIEIPFTKEGTLDQTFLKDHLDGGVSCVLVQSPNFFGVIEDVRAVGLLTKDLPALFVVATAEALAYVAISSPGEAGADIAVGEGASFGLGLNYGGPYLGLFACKQDFLRQMPGRLVGETRDASGRRGYVLTFATREQHIRRERATSNICTNQGLCALMCSIYLSLLGTKGLTEIALVNMRRRQLLEDKIREKSEAGLKFLGTKFNETVITLRAPAKDVVIKLLKDKILAGLDLSTYYPELNNHLLVCVTEMTRVKDIERLASRLGDFLP